MPVFVRVVSFSTFGGKFDASKDSRVINQVLQELQNKGARIINVCPAIGGGILHGIAATYTITYESPSPIE
jgi:predicted CoA-binding protein